MSLSAVLRVDGDCSTVSRCHRLLCCWWLFVLLPDPPHGSQDHWSGSGGQLPSSAYSSSIMPSGSHYSQSSSYIHHPEMVSCQVVCLLVTLWVLCPSTMCITQKWWVAGWFVCWSHYEFCAHLLCALPKNGELWGGLFAGHIESLWVLCPSAVYIMRIRWVVW